MRRKRTDDEMDEPDEYDEMAELCPNDPLPPHMGRIDELPAFKVIRSDGSHYITSMSKGTTLEAAQKYFLHTWQTEEEQTTGKETIRQVVKVEAV